MAALLQVLASGVGATKATQVVTRHSLREGRPPLRILLAEDNLVNQMLASRILENQGHSVVVAPDGVQALRTLEQQPFDLVLMDIQMPVMDGLTATKLIRADERFRKLPILAMTAHAMNGDCERSLNAGMNDHITKPIDPNRLTAALIRWMPELHTERSASILEPTNRTPQEDGIPDQLPPFDIQSALARTNGKTKLLRKLMLGFRDQYASAGSELRELIVAGRVVDAERLAHSLKSVAAMLEARDLAEAASAVECAFRLGETEGRGSLIDTLENVLATAIVAVNSLDVK